MSQLKYFIHKDDKIAYRFIKRTKKTIVFIHGLCSDMSGKKSIFLANYSKKKDYSYLCFDCRGHGKSSGKFEELSIVDWFDDLKEILKHLKINRNITLIGSSMGGWLACLYALYYPKNINKLIGLAPAPDFTERLIWKKLSNFNKNKIRNNKLVKIKISNYFQYIYSKKLIFESRAMLLSKLDTVFKNETIFLNGSKDESVPYNYNDNLLKSDHFTDLKIKIIKNENHSLSTSKTLSILAGEI